MSKRKDDYYLCKIRLSEECKLHLENLNEQDARIDELEAAIQAHKDAFTDIIGSSRKALWKALEAADE